MGLAKKTSARARGASSRKYVGVIAQPGGHVAYATFRQVRVSAGTWPSARLAAIARDRLVLYSAPERALNFPREARALGPAFAAALQNEARLLAKGAHTKKQRYFGVVEVKHRKVFAAQVWAAGKAVNVGYYDEPRLAAEIYDRVATYQWRNNPSRRVLLNFPNKALSPMSPAAARAFARRLRKETSKTSRYRGVYRDPRKLARTWLMHCVACDASGEGALRYRTERQAAIAYDRAMLHYQGRSAILNFPHLAAALVPASIATLRAACLRERKGATSSRFVGVWQEASGRWRAGYGKGKTKHLGTFDTEEKAAEAYDKAVLKLARGRGRVRLNFHPKTGAKLGGQWFELG